MTLRQATSDDIPAIMAIERQPGYEALVGRSSAEFHARAVIDPDYAYLAGLDADGAMAGFAILRGLSDLTGNVTLKRFVVAAPGKGMGTALLREVIDWTFTNTSAHRFWLDHIVTNDRARHVYERCGFRREGVMREAYAMPDDGGRVDLALMSLLRPEWERDRKVFTMPAAYPGR
ncbi:MAG: GNAT family N-acetyltransferase [Rhizobiaceae bacterium]|nr:GNAT family N-acetyltransferase [Rhizobiaceae bacterium]